jgi:hypothetical protein
LNQIGIPEAGALEQGELAAVALKPTGTLAMLGLIVRGALGRLGGAEHVVSISFRSMAVSPARGRAQRRIKVATDGEVRWMQMPLLFRVAPEPLWLLKPGPREDGEARA